MVYFVEVDVMWYCYYFYLSFVLSAVHKKRIPLLVEKDFTLVVVI